MPFEGKINTNRRYPVYLYDGDMSGVAGVAVGSIFVVYAHEDDSSFSTYSANAGNWREFGGGKYTLEVSGSVFNASGIYFITVSGSSFKDYNFDVEVRGQYLADYFDKIYNVTPATLIATQSDINSLNDPSASEVANEVVSSGNAAGWSDGATASEVWSYGTRDLTDYNISAIASDVTASGQSAGFDNIADLTTTNSKIDDIAGSGSSWVTADLTTLESRLSAARAGYLDNLAIGDLVASSGQISNLNNLTAQEIASEVISSGQAAGFDNVADLTTTNNKIDDIAASGTAWTTATASDVSGATVTTSGLTPEALSQIVSSGNSANWDATASIPQVTVSGFTASALADINLEVDNAFSDYDPPTRNELTSDKEEIIASGNLYWVTADVSSLATSGELSTVETNLSGLIESNTTEILSSGVNWVTATGFSTPSDIISARDSIIATGQANWLTASGFPTETSISNQTVSDLLASTVDGTGVNEVTVSSFYQHALSWVRGDVNHFNSGVYYYNEYKDPNGAILYVERVGPSGRELQ